MQKLLVLERQTKEKLQQAIENVMDGAQFEIQTLQVRKIGKTRGYEAWIIINIPENPNKRLLQSGELLVGFE